MFLTLLGLPVLDPVGIRAHRDRKLISTPPLKSPGTNVKLETKNLRSVSVFIFGEARTDENLSPFQNHDSVFRVSKKIGGKFLWETFRETVKIGLIP